MKVRSVSVFLNEMAEALHLRKWGKFYTLMPGKCSRLKKEVEYQITLLKNGKKGRLRIASTYVPLNFLLPDWLAAFKTSSPQTEIELKSGNSAQVLESLLQYESDVAIAVIEDLHHEEILTSHLTNLSYDFIVPADHPLNGKTVPLERLSQEPFF
ncbi:hypothetical protein BsIDN1_13320 [Bacillus safensis]|uniref:LysR substrate-binding domain-containing protein n=1 Tax=Bacillus safensis TaxID=561879 RepID=A0A5S9M6C3_BACIA|nr:hypothetical protein BsIDN1_13320 [Bacillus safensis]